MDSPGGFMLTEVRQKKTNTVCFHLHTETKNKWMQQKRLTGTENKSSGYQWGEGWSEGQDRGKGLRGTN